MTYDKDPKHLFLQTVNEEGLNYRNQGRPHPADGPTTMARAVFVTCRPAIC
jgi:hypothetical protein